MQNAPGWGAKLGLVGCKCPRTGCKYPGVGCKIIKKRPGWGAKLPKMTLSGVQIRPKRVQVGCIVSFKPILGKNSRYPSGYLEFFVAGRDSNDQMQRGRALPVAAGRNGTLIFAKGENANESLPAYAQLCCASSVLARGRVHLGCRRLRTRTTGDGLTEANLYLLPLGADANESLPVCLST